MGYEVFPDDNSDTLALWQGISWDRSITYAVRQKMSAGESLTKIWNVISLARC